MKEEIKEEIKMEEKESDAENCVCVCACDECMHDLMSFSQKAYDKMSISCQ